MAIDGDYENTGGIIRLGTSPFRFGLPFHASLVIVGDEHKAILKGVLEAFDSEHRHVIARLLREQRFTSAGWWRHDPDGIKPPRWAQFDL